MLALSFLLTLAAPALAAIGDQPAAEWCLQGDIQSEKELEGQMFTIFGLAATGAAAMGGPFALLTAGTGAVSLGLGQLADPKNATWENWPEGRYVFHHAPPEKFLDIGVMAEKALYSSIEFMANMLFSATKTLTRTSNNIIVLAFNTSIVSGMAGWVSAGLADIFSPQGDLTQVLVMTGLILLIVSSIFKFLRGQAMSALNATIVACLALGGVFLFTAHAQQIIAKTAEATDSVAGVCLSAVGKYTSAGQNINIDDPLNRGVAAAGQTAWQVIVAKPWALGQFGTSDESRLTLTQDEYDTLDKKSFPRESQGKIRPGMRLDTIMLGSGPEGRSAVAEAVGRPNAKFLWVFDGKEVDHGQHNGTMNGFAPTAAATHLKIAAFTLLPAIGYALLASLVGLSIVLSQVALAVLLIMLPLALFAAMVPDTGWAFAARYARTTMSFFMVKLVYGLYLSLVLTVGTGFANAVTNSADNLGAAMLLLAAIFTAAALGRKKFLGFVLDSVQKGATGYGEKISGSTKKILENNYMLARRLGMTSVLTDWWFSRRRGSQGMDEGGGPGPAGNTDIGIWEIHNMKRALPPGSQGVDNGAGGTWEGHPPSGAPFKELPPGRVEGSVPRATGGGRPHPGMLDTARATPKGIRRNSPSAISSGAPGAKPGVPAGRDAAAGRAGAAVSGAGPAAAGSSAGNAAVGGAAAGAAAGAGAAVAVGAAAASGVKKFAEGEIEVAAGLPVGTGGGEKQTASRENSVGGTFYSEVSPGSAGVKPELPGGRETATVKADATVPGADSAVSPSGGSATSKVTGWGVAPAVPGATATPQSPDVTAKPEPVTGAIIPKRKSPE